MFSEGQKVECIIDGDEGPRLGSISTVSREYTAYNGQVCIELVEYPAPQTDDHFAGYWAGAFRAVVESEADISVFTDMLNPTKFNA